MSLAERLVAQLETSRKLFRTTTSVFESADGGFSPDPLLYTVAGHIAHAADAIEWFTEGAFGSGWDLDFESSIAKARSIESLEEARAWLDRAFTHAIDTVDAASDEELQSSIVDRTILGDAPRLSVINGIVDHTAHHRGSLAVYARLLGKAPPMLYS